VLVVLAMRVTVAGVTVHLRKEEQAARRVCEFPLSEPVTALAQLSFQNVSSSAEISDRPRYNFADLKRMILTYEDDLLERGDIGESSTSPIAISQVQG
jgi:hypothetical protein